MKNASLNLDRAEKDISVPPEWLIGSKLKALHSTTPDQQILDMTTKANGGFSTDMRIVAIHKVSAIQHDDSASNDLYPANETLGPVFVDKNRGDSGTHNSEVTIIEDYLIELSNTAGGGFDGSSGAGTGSGQTRTGQ